MQNNESVKTAIILKRLNSELIHLIYTNCYTNFLIYTNSFNLCTVHTVLGGCFKAVAFGWKRLVGLNVICRHFETDEYI